MALGLTRTLTEMSIPGVFPGGNGGRCVRLTTLPPSCAIVMKSGNLNFLEPSGPLQACNGTDLPLTFICIYYCSFSTTEMSYLKTHVTETSCLHFYYEARPRLDKSQCIAPVKSHTTKLTLNLPTTTIVAQPFNTIKWQLKFNPVA